MGGSNSIYVYNSTSRNAFVNVSDNSSTISSGQTFAAHELSGNVYIQVQIKNDRGYVIKRVSFHSYADHSWIIRNDGVIRQKYGETVQTQDPQGEFHEWEEDNEAYFQAQEEETSKKERIQAQRQRAAASLALAEAESASRVSAALEAAKLKAAKEAAHVKAVLESQEAAARVRAVLEAQEAAHVKSVLEAQEAAALVKAALEAADAARVEAAEKAVELALELEYDMEETDVRNEEWANKMMEEEEISEIDSVCETNIPHTKVHDWDEESEALDPEDVPLDDDVKNFASKAFDTVSVVDNHCNELLESPLTQFKEGLQRLAESVQNEDTLMKFIEGSNDIAKFITEEGDKLSDEEVLKLTSSTITKIGMLFSAKLGKGKSEDIESFSDKFSESDFALPPFLQIPLLECLKFPQNTSSYQPVYKLLTSKKLNTTPAVSYVRTKISTHFFLTIPSKYTPKLLRILTFVLPKNFSFEELSEISLNMVEKLQSPEVDRTIGGQRLGQLIEKACSNKTFRVSQSIPIRVLKFLDDTMEAFPFPCLVAYVDSVVRESAAGGSNLEHVLIASAILAKATPNTIDPLRLSAIIQYILEPDVTRHPTITDNLLQLISTCRNQAPMLSLELFQAILDELGEILDPDSKNKPSIQLHDLANIIQTALMHKDEDEGSEHPGKQFCNDVGTYIDQYIVSNSQGFEKDSLFGDSLEPLYQISSVVLERGYVPSDVVVGCTFALLQRAQETKKEFVGYIASTILQALSSKYQRGDLSSAVAHSCVSHINLIGALDSNSNFDWPPSLASLHASIISNVPEVPEADIVKLLSAYFRFKVKSESKMIIVDAVKALLQSDADTQVLSEMILGLASELGNSDPLLTQLSASCIPKLPLDYPANISALTSYATLAEGTHFSDSTNRIIAPLLASSNVAFPELNSAAFSLARRVIKTNLQTDSNDAKKEDACEVFLTILQTPVTAKVKEIINENVPLLLAELETTKSAGPKFLELNLQIFSQLHFKSLLTDKWKAKIVNLYHKFCRILLSESLPRCLEISSFVEYCVTKNLTQYPGVVENSDLEEFKLLSALQYFADGQTLTDEFRIVFQHITSREETSGSLITESLSAAANLLIYSRSEDYVLICANAKQILSSALDLLKHCQLYLFWEPLTYLYFQLELHFGINSAALDSFNGAKQSIHNASKTSELYLALTEKAFIDRTGESTVEFNDSDIRDSWIFEWTTADALSVRNELFRSEAYLTLTDRTRLIGFCCMAYLTPLDEKYNVTACFEAALDVLHHPDDLEAVQSRTLAENICEIQQLLEDNQRPLLQSLVKQMIYQYTAIDEMERVKSLSGIVALEEFDTESAIALRPTFEILRQRVAEYMTPIEAIRYETLVKKKLLIFPTKADDILKYMLMLGEFLDVQVIEDYPLDQWPSQLLRSYFIARLGLINNTKDFDQLWYSALSYHGMIELPKLSFFSRMITISNQVIDDWDIEKAFLFLFVIHIRALPEVPGDEVELSFVNLKENWLRFHFKTLAEGDSEKFWNCVQNFGFVSTKSSSFFSLYEIVQLLCDAGTVLEFTDFISIASNHDLTPTTIRMVLNSDMSQKQATIRDFTVQLQMHAIEEVMNDMFFRNESNESSQCCQSNCSSWCKSILLNKRLEFELVFEIIKSVETRSQEVNEVGKGETKYTELLAKILYILYSYDISQEEQAKVIEVVTQSEPEIWLSGINQLVLQSSGGSIAGETPLDQLVTELISMNESADEDFLGEVDKFKTIIENLEVCEMNEEEITKWVQSHDRSSTSISQYISVLSQALKLHGGFRPRNSQLLSTFILLDSITKGGKGRLAKINTGEGKSIIIALVAGYLGLQGKQVDIITVSSILAERDAVEFERYYKLLGISSGHVNGVQEKRGTPKSCYSNQILYGDPSTFQGDVLRQEFSMLNTRGKRGFDVAIVDEVDSMFIDQGGHSTRLVEKMPAMEHLEVVYLGIWFHLNSYANLLIPINGSEYAMEGESKPSLMDAIGSLTKYKNGPTLHAELIKFAELSLKNELDDKNIKNSIRDLISFGVIGSNPRDATQVSDQDINEAITNRWNLKSKSVKLDIVQKLLSIRIKVFAFDTDEGLVLSSEYHDSKIPMELPETTPCIHFIGIQKQFTKLSVIEDRTVYFKSKVGNAVRSIFQFSNSQENKIMLPAHLQRLFNAKIDVWIDSAIKAKYFVTEARDYVIKPDCETKEMRIVPVDYENTGIIQESSVWSDGLQQFVQIKHNLRISPENLATNFLSNLVFFRRYDKRILGLTGTLGSEKEQLLLKAMYNTDSINVPTFQKPRHKNLPDIVAVDTNHWFNAIATSVHAHALQNRAVLVVCKTINQVKKIQTYLKKYMETAGESKATIGIYTRSDKPDEVNLVKEKMKPGSVIIATNLAGRGTNIKFNEQVLTNGGLHVCIAFLPDNIRVEQQAAGRASRKGDPGSSQLILKSVEDGLFPDLETFLDPVDMKRCRDNHESKVVEKIQNETVPKLLKEDTVFQRYLKIRKACAAGTKDEFERKHTLAALDERWGVALDISKAKEERDNAHQKLREVNQGLASGSSTATSVGERAKDVDLAILTASESALAQELVVIQNSSKKIENPYYHILLGNLYNRKKKYQEALDSFEMCFKMDEFFSAFANYYMCFSLIAGDLENSKTLALEKLSAAIQQIENVEIPLLTTLQNLGAKNSKNPASSEDNLEGIEADTPFTQQICEKITFFKALSTSAQSCIDNLNKYDKCMAEMMNADEFKDESGVAQVSPKVAAEFRYVGFCGFIKIKQRPSPWWAIFTVIFVGVLQVLVGAVLTICTGGSYGSGLITEGLTDCYTGISAAVKGEYIDLKAFYKQKAITLAISAICAGAGALLSKAATFVSTAISKIGAKIASSAVGKFFSTVGGKHANFGSKIFNFTKTAANSIGSGAKNLVNKVRTFTKNMASRAWNSTAGFRSRLTSTLKLDKAWAAIQKGYKAVKTAVMSTFKQIKQIVTKPFSALSESTKGQFLQVTKQIGKELANSGIQLGIEAAVIQPLHDTIENALVNKIKEQVETELNDGRTGKAFIAYLSKATNKAEFTQLRKEVQNKIIGTIEKNMEAGNSDASNVFQQIKQYISMTKGLLSQGKGQGGWSSVINSAVSIATTCAEYGILIEALVSYISRSLTKLADELEATQDKVEEVEGQVPKRAVYLATKEGSTDVAALKKALASILSKNLAAKMASIIKTGVLNPAKTFCVDQFVSRVALYVKEEEKATVACDSAPVPTTTEKDDKFQIENPEDIVTFATEEILSLMSTHLNAPLEIYSYDGHGLNLLQSSGSMSSCLSGPDIAASTIRIIATQIRGEDGTAQKHYHTIGEDGQLQLVQSAGSSTDNSSWMDNVTSLVGAFANGANSDPNVSETLVRAIKSRSQFMSDSFNRPIRTLISFLTSSTP